MTRPHLIAIPYPAQGHVIPLLELSQCLANSGFKITFINTEFDHERIVKSMADEACLGDNIRLVPIPDGLERGEDRNELGRLSTAIFQVMPGKLEELINNINRKEDDKITCLIAELNLGWAFEVAEKLNIAKVAFWPASAATLVSGFCIPRMIEEGIIDRDGKPIKKGMFQLLPGMPAMDPANLAWACIGESVTQKIIFNIMANNNKIVNLADWVLCNSSRCLELAAFNFAPLIQPIGPLLASNRLGSSAGFFWPEDSNSLKWLDQQPPRSVIYVAFGSFTVFDQIQFQELALGLEFSNRPFLWVVRPDVTCSPDDFYPEGYINRVASRGKLVDWAPQQKVLSHPSIACFISHCGWNSTMEGVGNGVLFLCWPYFADQFVNESYICDVWQTGLKLDRNDKGIITREEIKHKVDQLIGDAKFSNRALQLKSEVMSGVQGDGVSSKNFNNFVEWLKAL